MVPIPTNCKKTSNSANVLAAKHNTMQPTNDNTYQQIRIMGAIGCAVLLALHYYYYCYQAVDAWGFTHPIADRFVGGLARSGLFRHRALSKVMALACLAATTAGVKSPVQARSRRRLILSLAGGTLLYFGGDLVLVADGDLSLLAGAYITVTLGGLAILYTGVRALISLLTWPFRQDIFNRYNESFPQEERLITNPYSINLRARYVYRNRTRDSWINLIEIFRSTLVMGSPGSAKTSHIFRQMIQQSLAHGMALFVYDLKYDDLTRLTYNTLQQIQKAQATPSKSAQPAPVPLTFFSLNFDDFTRSHRCNPLDPATLDDISDAAESARTILLALNRDWIRKQGDFFVESAIGFFTANIWFLRRYENGKYCTLAHLLELIQVDFYRLFSIIRSVPEAETLVQPYVSALANNAGEQLQGQVDSARIALSTLVSPQLYYLLSANDFTLDLNNPNAPKVICLGSNPQKQHIYGAVISLYVSRMLKLVNRKGGRPCHLFFDEFASFTALGMHLTVAQARQNRVAVTFGIQDLSQLRMEYGRDHADALFNLPGNLISGQVSGDSARLVSERFGKILQDKATVSTNSRDSSTSQSQQLDLALPASKIATLSSGEFVGITADSPMQPLPLKAFHARVVVDFAAIQREESTWQPIPEVRTVTPDLVDFNFRQIKQQVLDMVESRLAQMRQNPTLARLIVTKREGLHQRRQTP